MTLENMSEMPSNPGKKFMKEIISPIEYRFESVERIPHTSMYEVVLSARNTGVKHLKVEKKDLLPLMECTSSRTLSKLPGKHIISNEVGCPLMQEINGEFLDKNADS